MLKFFYCFLSYILFFISYGLYAEYELNSDDFEQKIIHNIIEYQKSVEGDGLPQTRGCLFQTQITQFNIPFVISTPGYYCIAAQTTLNALQNGQNATSSIQNSVSFNQINPINTTGQSTFQIVQPSLQTTPFTIVNGHLIQQQQNLTVQQQQAVVQQQTNGQNITVSDFQIRAITVNSNDVVIDLNGNEIIGIGTTNTTGIVVNGFPNILIKNGTIRNMTNNGITIANNTSTGRVPQNIGVQNVTFFNNRNGMSITSAIDVVLLKNEAYFCSATGFILNQNTNVIIDSCISNNNVTGFSTTGNIAFQFLNCTANSNTGPGFINNFLIESAFQQCTAHENQTGFIIAPSNGTSANVNFIQNFAHDNTTNGFQIAGNDITLEECKANNNTNGFQINGNNNVLLNCIAQGNVTNGILLAAALSVNTTSSNCQVRENTLTNNNIGINNLGVNNHIYSNFASNNKGGDFVNVSNVAISPTPLTPINFTTNIAE